MKSESSKLLALLLSLLLLLSGCGNSIFATQPNNEHYQEDMPGGEYTPDMWLATSPDGTGRLYLFGSIHVGDDTVFPLPEYVTDAYQESDYVAVECDIVAFEKLSADKIAEYYYPIIYTDGTTISDHIDADIYEACKKILTENGMYSPYLDVYHPTMWSSMLSNVALSYTDFEIDSGIDRYFINEATDDGKGILEIEDIADQITMDLQFPDEMLSYMLSEFTEKDVFEQYDDDLTEMFAAWKTGNLEEYLLDEEQTQELTEQEEYFDELYEKVTLIDRNIGMAAKAIEYIVSGKDVFYIVGAAHMYGDNGVIALLEDEGVTVTPIN